MYFMFFLHVISHRRGLLPQAEDGLRRCELRHPGDDNTISMCVCVYIYIYTHTHAYINKYMHIYIYISIYAYTYYKTTIIHVYSTLCHHTC